MPAKKPQRSNKPTSTQPLTTQKSPAPKIDARHQLDRRGWLESGRWVNTTSSNVAGIAYSKEERRLFVQFHSGKIYYYIDVPLRIAGELYGAGSIGIYLSRNIKGKYTYVGPLSSVPIPRPGTRREVREGEVEEFERSSE